MAEIIESIEQDKDTVDENTLNQHFSKNCILRAEIAVSLKQSYINKLHGTKSSKIAVSLSDNTIELYELSKTSLNKYCKFSGHEKAITDLVFSPDNDNLIYSSSLDGIVKLWDSRAKRTCVSEYKDDDGTPKPIESFDISCNGKVLCAGTQQVQDDAFIVFWDHRLTKPLGGYWNSHTDDITQVKFHKEKVEILATGSLDGLINIFNITEHTEDDALIYSLNVENSVEKLNWLDEKKLSCITQSNDLQIWDSESGDLLKSFSRDKVAYSMKRSKGDDCYLIDTYISSDETPVLLAGSNAGNGEVLRTLQITEKKLVPRTNFVNNKQVVRCIWYDQEKNTLITGGESGIISVWEGSEEETQDIVQTSTKLSKKLNKLHVHRKKPY